MHSAFMEKIQNPLLRDILLTGKTGLEKWMEPVFIERGLKYFRQGRVVAFHWENEGDSLTASVAGTHLYAVRVSLSKSNHPVTSCDCPAWSSYGQCKHVACVILTIQSLLIGEDLFEGSRKRRAELLKGEPCFLKKRQLAGDHKDNPGLELHFQDSNEEGFLLRFKKYGFFLSADSRQIPKELRSLAMDSDAATEEAIGSGACLGFFKKPSVPYSIFIHTHEGIFEAKWDPEAVLKIAVQFDHESGRIVIRKTGQSGGQMLEAFYLVGFHFFLDPAKGILGHVAENSVLHYARFLETEQEEENSEKEPAWHGQNFAVQKSFKNASRPVFIEPALWNRKAFAFFAVGPGFSAQDLLLTENKSPVSPKETVPELSISFLKHTDPLQMMMEARLEMNGLTLSWDHSVFGLLNPAIHREERAVFFRTAKQRTLFYRTLAALASAESDKERDRVIGEAVKDPALQKFWYGQEHFRRFLKMSAAFFKNRHRKETLLTPEGWRTVVYDLPAVYEIFNQVRVFWGDLAEGLLEGLSVPVSKKTVLEILPVFYSQLRKHGVKIYFDKKAVEETKLDFSVRAETEDLDWFSVHPSVSFQGAPVPEEKWAGILAGKSIFEHNGVVQLLDQNTQKVLEMLGRFVKRGNPEEKNGGKEYVRVPRLQILDWVLLRKRGVQVSLPQEEESLLERLLNFEKIEKRAMPVNFLGKLRPYQKEGYHWLAFHYEHGFGACLADDMGLGKTVQAIAFLAGIYEGKIPTREGNKKTGPHLMVLPPTLVFNWQNEIERFYPDFKVLVYTGGMRQADFEGIDIILTTYDIVRRDLGVLNKHFFHTLLFDEAQNVKNLFAQRTGAVRQLRAHFKMCLTGTPLENHLGEYYSIIDLCVPGLLGEYGQFQSDTRDGVADFLIERTRPFVLRRAKTKILKELPPKSESDIYLELTEAQKKLYTQMAKEAKKTLEGAYRKMTEAQARVVALTALLRLRQICVSASLLDSSVKEVSPKTEYLISKLRELAEENHAAIVFSQFTGFLDLLEKDLRRGKIPFVRMDGKTPMKKRKQMVEAFQTGAGPGVFLISLKTGGVGLNLTRASYVFHLDPWWNPAVDRQASDRVHRIGQEKHVFVTRILMRHTVEEKVMKLRDSKQKLFDAVMGGEAGMRSAARITREDFEFLLG